jgi:hypothetical protein
MKKKSKLDQDFADSSDVKIEVVPNKNELIIELKDMEDRRCIFHFEKLNEFSIFYSDDSADTTDIISKIKLVKKTTKYEEFEIIYTAETKSKIICKTFWYETDY